MGSGDGSIRSSRRPRPGARSRPGRARPARSDRCVGASSRTRGPPLLRHPSALARMGRPVEGAGRPKLNCAAGDHRRRGLDVLGDLTGRSPAATAVDRCARSDGRPVNDLDAAGEGGFPEQGMPAVHRDAVAAAVQHRDAANNGKRSATRHPIAPRQLAGHRGTHARRLRSAPSARRVPGDRRSRCARRGPASAHRRHSGRRRVKASSPPMRCPSIPIAARRRPFDVGSRLRMRRTRARRWGWARSWCQAALAASSSTSISTAPSVLAGSRPSAKDVSSPE